MRKSCTILFLLSIAFCANAQDSCLPLYNLPVKNIKLTTGRMAYVEKGKGKTILFIHGLGGNSAHWIKSVNELSAWYKCIAIDLPGYGWSDKTIDTKGKDLLQFYADAVGEFLKKKNIKKVFLAGHSMGAQVAIITALQNKKIKKLILVAAAGLETFTQKEAQLLIAATPAASFEKQDEAAIRNSFKLNFFVQPADAEALIQYRLQMRNCPGFKLYCQTVSAGIKGMLAHPVKDSLKYLSMPVLILSGSNDNLIPNRYLHPSLKTVDLIKESAALIANSKIAMIENAGHMVLFEKSTETNSIIKNFLQ